MSDDRILQASTEAPLSERLLSTSLVCRITGRSRSSIFRDVDRGVFPAPVKIGPKSNAWLQSEVAAWMEALPRRRGNIEQ